MSKLLSLSGRRWFDRKNGNTYFSAVATLASQGQQPEEIARINFQYGYDDQWIVSICEAASRSGVLPLSMERRWPWQWLNALKEDHGFFVTTDVVDVNRRKDL